MSAMNTLIPHTNICTDVVYVIKARLAWTETHLMSNENNKYTHVLKTDSDVVM